MAQATARPTPNPNAMKFELDTTLDESFNFATPAAATGHAFGQAAFEVEGVKSVFGVNDFVTISREPDADWEPIIAGITEAARLHL